MKSNLVWKFSTIEHIVRDALGLSIPEYCYLDLIYKNQTHPDFNKGGYCSRGVRWLGAQLSLGKSTINNYTERAVRRGLLEVHPNDKSLKKTTPLWYNFAYLRDPGQEILAEIVQEVQAVQKLDTTVQELDNKCPEIGHTPIIEKEREKIDREKALDPLVVRSIELIKNINELSGRKLSTNPKDKSCLDNVKVILKALKFVDSWEVLEGIAEMKIAEYKAGEYKREWIRPETLYKTKLHKYLETYRELQEPGQMEIWLQELQKAAIRNGKAERSNTPKQHVKQTGVATTMADRLKDVYG